eukprot:7522831-Alexandrium_andersonii.AAC.1
MPQSKLAEDLSMARNQRRSEIPRIHGRSQEVPSFARRCHLKLGGLRVSLVPSCGEGCLARCARWRPCRL